MTRTDLMNAEISARILSRVAAGSDLKTAIDAILCAGTYAKIASDTYDEIRARHGRA